MTSWCCMLIGEKIVEEIKSCDKLWGTFDGFDDKNVVGVFCSRLNTEKITVCEASLIICNHRSFSDHYKKDVAYWVKLDKSEIDKIVNYDMTLESLSQYLPQEFPIINEVSESVKVLAICKTTEDIQLFSLFKIDSKTYLVPGDVQKLPESIDPYNRLDGLVALSFMKEMTATIVGIGSGGATIALELASAGIGSLFLFDKDRLDYNNIFRHICSLIDLGRNKTDAVESVIRDHLLPTKIKKCTSDILVYSDELVDAISKSDITICATDNTETREYLNYLCLNLNKPLILVCTYDNAKIGEIIRVIPHQTACYKCTRLHLSKMNIMIEDNKRENTVRYAPQDENNTSNSRGTGADVHAISCIATKVALMTLGEHKELGFGKLFSNYIVWGTDSNTKFESPFRFTNPFSANYVNFSKVSECPLCGNLPDDIVGVSIEDEYDEIIQKIVNRDEIS